MVAKIAVVSLASTSSESTFSVLGAPRATVAVARRPAACVATVSLPSTLFLAPIGSLLLSDFVGHT